MKFYVVGGAIRDALLDKVPHDYDIVVEGATPETMMEPENVVPYLADLALKQITALEQKVAQIKIQDLFPLFKKPGGLRWIPTNAGTGTRMNLLSIDVRKHLPDYPQKICLVCSTSLRLKVIGKIV